MNLPTKITLARIGLVPVIIALFCLKEVFPYYYVPMTLLYILTSCTDAVDGYLARKHNMVTDLGKFLDPIADKILVVTGLIILLDMNFIIPGTDKLFPVMPPYGGVIGVIAILAREFIIGVLRQMAAAKGVVLAADNWGKAKTVVTLIFIPMLMFVPLINVDIAGVMWTGIVFLFLGWALFAVATLMTLFSGLNYIIKNKHVFEEIKGMSKGDVDTKIIDGNLVDSESSNTIDASSAIDNIDINIHNNIDNNKDVDAKMQVLSSDKE